MGTDPTEGGNASRAAGAVCTTQGCCIHNTKEQLQKRAKIGGNKYSVIGTIRIYNRGEGGLSEW